MKRTSRLALAAATAALIACGSMVDGNGYDTSGSPERDASLETEDASFAPDGGAAIVITGCQVDDDCVTSEDPLCSVRIDASVGIGTCVPDPNEKDANTPCSEGCGTYQGCGYRIADGCSATTKYCFDPLYLPGRGSASWVFAACGCDGGEVDYGAGNGFDLEHVPAPVVAGVSCQQLAFEDAGDASDAD